MNEKTKGKILTMLTPIFIQKSKISTTVRIFGIPIYRKIDMRQLP